MVILLSLGKNEQHLFQISTPVPHSFFLFSTNCHLLSFTHKKAITLASSVTQFQNFKSHTRNSVVKLYLLYAIIIDSQEIGKHVKQRHTGSESFYLNGYLKE